MEGLKIDIGQEKPMEVKSEEPKVDENKPKKNNDGRNILIMIVVMLGIFVLFTGGFKAYNKFTGSAVVNLDYLHQLNSQGKLDSNRGYMYQGYSFVYNEGLWYTEVRDANVLTKIPLHFGPRNVSQVKVTGSLSPDFNKGDKVYVAIDPEFSSKYYTLALSELSFNIVKGIRRQPEAACTENNTICEGRKILNCEAPDGKPVIELKWANQTSITSKGTCILIQGKDYGIVQAVDRLVLQWYGVMK